MTFLRHWRKPLTELPLCHCWSQEDELVDTIAETTCPECLHRLTRTNLADSEYLKRYRKKNRFRGFLDGKKKR